MASVHLDTKIVPNSQVCKGQPVIRAVFSWFPFAMILLIFTRKFSFQGCFSVFIAFCISRIMVTRTNVKKVFVLKPDQGRGD